MISYFYEPMANTALALFLYDKTNKKILIMNYGKKKSELKKF